MNNTKKYPCPNCGGEFTTNDWESDRKGVQCPHCGAVVELVKDVEYVFDEQEKLTGGGGFSKNAVDDIVKFFGYKHFIFVWLIKAVNIVFLASLVIGFVLFYGVVLTGSEVPMGIFGVSLFLGVISYICFRIVSEIIMIGFSAVEKLNQIEKNTRK
jgi:DNA-directed RNA polymerase subunit RPC12/RpoP